METHVTVLGFDEFAAALSGAASTIHAIFNRAAYNTALAVRSGAQEKVAKRTYTLMSSIIAEPLPNGAQVTVMELYGTYVEHGTGLYGPHKQRITPKNGNVMAWRGAGGKMMFARSTKGQKAQPFFEPAIVESYPVLAEQLLAGLDSIIVMLAGETK